jgi:hypothetical protein
MSDMPEEFFSSKVVRGVFIGIGITLGVLLVFKLGTAVGHHKALFSCKGDERYGRAFTAAVSPQMFTESFSAAHGAAGNIVGLNLPTFVVADQDHVEKVIRINDRTQVRRLRSTVAPEELRVDDFVVVIGEPNEENQVEAKLIRILPPPPVRP